LQKRMPIIFLIIFLLFSFPVSAGQLERDIELEGLDINYDIHQNLISARGEVIFRYGEVFLSCKELIIDLDGEVLIARGEVFLQDGDKGLKGEELEYFFVEGRGEIISPETSYDELTIWGEKLILTTELSEIKKAELTPCQLPEPHYRISSRRVVISPDGLIEAFHVTVSWGNTPFFYLPYYVARYEDGTITSPFPRPSFGYNSQKGIFFGLTFDHQITDKLTGEYFFETTSRDYLYLGDFSFQHNPTENLEGDLSFVIEQGKPMELGVSYEYNISPAWDLLGGLGRIDGDYFLLTGFAYSDKKIDHNLLLDWELLETSLFRARGEINLDSYSLSGDWQRYRDRFLADLSWREGDLEWWVRYRKGTDVERLPQARLSFHTGPAGSGFLDFGNFKQGNVSSTRFGGQYNLSRSWDPFSARLRLEGYDYPHYGLQGSIEGRISWTREWRNHDFAVGILARKVWGDTPFDFDRIEKKQQVFGEWTAKFNEDNNFPVYNTGLEINFDLINHELSKLAGSLQKKEDCYFWKIEIDPVQREFEFTLGTPF